MISQGPVGFKGGTGGAGMVFQGPLGFSVPESGPPPVVTIGFIDAVPVIRLAVGGEIYVAHGVDCVPNTEVAIRFKKDITPAATADPDTSPALEAQEIEIRKGKDPR